MKKNVHEENHFRKNSLLRKTLKNLRLPCWLSSSSVGAFVFFFLLPPVLVELILHGVQPNFQVRFIPCLNFGRFSGFGSLNTPPSPSIKQLTSQPRMHVMPNLAEGGTLPSEPSPRPPWSLGSGR